MLDDRLSIEVKQSLNLNAKLVLFWQPKISLFNGEITGAEALLRAIDQNGMVISPASIIKRINELNYWNAVGNAIIEDVLYFSKSLENSVRKDLVLSFNVDAKQLEEPTFIEFFAKTLNYTNANPRLIEIELTESAIIQNIEHSIIILNKLKDYGLRIAVDDFGTGYSSFSYVQQLPITTLKIDKSFIDNCPYNDKDVQIVKAIIQMSKSLRFKTIAEGIERLEQAQFLDKLGCEELQGWLFSKALPENEFINAVLNKKSLSFSEHKQESRKLLIVDDEPNILSALNRTLHKEGYVIKLANSAEEALSCLSEFEPDVIISDQRMPGMTGVEMFRQIRNLAPDACRIILSGFTELDSVTSAINDGAVWKFLTKPWDEDLLKSTIKEAFINKEIKDENIRLTAQIEEANHELKRLNKQLNSTLEENKKSNHILEKQLYGYQHIIDSIPTPTLGISENMIVLANAAAKELFELPLILDDITDIVNIHQNTIILKTQEYQICKNNLHGESTWIISLMRLHYD